MALDSSEHIIIEGARQNNLKGINLKLPLRKLIVVTGPGKFSLGSNIKSLVRRVQL